MGHTQENCNALLVLPNMVVELVALNARTIKRWDILKKLVMLCMAYLKKLVMLCMAYLTKQHKYLNLKNLSQSFLVRNITNILS